MWKLLHNRTAQAVSSWLGILTVVFAVLGKLSPTWLGQLTWPEAILFGIGLALATVFLLSLALAISAWGWRLYRPLSDSEKADARQGAENKLAQSNAKIGLIERNLEALSEELKQELATHKKHMSDCYSAQDEARRKDIASLTLDIQEIRRACAGLEETVKTNETRLRESLHAVFARERLKHLATVIDRNAAELADRLEQGEHYTATEWDSWVNTHHRWESALKQWIDLGRWYAQAVRDKILTVADDEYSNDWVVRDEQFPNADAVWRFKKHRIIHAHWLSVRSDVHTGAELVAFSAQAERDLHRGQYHQ